MFKNSNFVLTNFAILVKNYSINIFEFQFHSTSLHSQFQLNSNSGTDFNSDLWLWFWMALNPGLHILTCSCCWRASSICWRCFSICEAASFFCSSWAARSCSRRLMSCVIIVESCRSFSARLSGVPATEHVVKHKEPNGKREKKLLSPWPCTLSQQWEEKVYISCYISQMSLTS